MTHEIVDIGVDDMFDVFIDANGDLSSVSGRAAFEQRVAVATTQKVQPLLGDVDRETARQQAILGVRRVASEMDSIDDAITVVASYSADKPNTLVVEVVYDTGGTFAFEVQE